MSKALRRSLAAFWHWLMDWHSWRACYTDGKYSVRMRYETAVTYVEVFGGHVEFDPPQKRKDDSDA